MTIFYFTATGNCLEIVKKIGGKGVSIPAILKGDQFDFEDDVIGLVVPNHHANIPIHVKEFMNKAQLKANYFFGIVTYGENNADANEKLLKAGKHCGISFDYINSIKMVDSSFVYWDIKKQIDTLPKKKVDEHLTIIRNEINQRQKRIYGVNFANRATGFIASIVSQETKHNERFYIEEDKCIQCGICLKVCPIDNIMMGDYPMIQDKCIRCGACTHNCPQNAIRYRGEKSRDRFRHQNVKLSEIINANDFVYSES